MQLTSCNKCGEPRKVGEKCSSCLKAYKAAYYKKNKERLRHAQTQYYKDNVDTIKENVKQWALDNPERKLENNRKYEKANQHNVSLILTDINMPRMDGYQLLELLRKISNYKSVPILMLTTESADDMKAKGKAAGATGWLVKPFDPKRLLEVIGKLIN